MKGSEIKGILADSFVELLNKIDADAEYTFETYYDMENDYQVSKSKPQEIQDSIRGFLRGVDFFDGNVIRLYRSL